MSGTNPILMPFLLPLSWMYWLLTDLRNFCYNHNILKSRSFDVPIISIGNITAGGTGKTPFVIALANWLEEQGYRVGIISRGYRRENSGQVVVKDHSGIHASVRQAGDEPSLMAQMTGKVVIIVDADRIAAAERITTEFGCNVILADDAFQHRRLKRQLDIVLWDSHQDPRKAHIIPAGRLRESISGLQRADLILISRTDSVPVSISDYFQRKQISSTIASVPMQITQIVRLSDGAKIPQSKLQHKKILGFCGLGNPDQFFNMLQILSDTEIIRKAYSDHHKYSARDITTLEQIATQKNCHYLVSTRKDAVNLPVAARHQENLLIVDIAYPINQKIKAVISEKLPPH
jgi:tetraacyldisaccharide 4'-kinase